MDNNIFTGGVMPGGLTNSLEIKILICYLLDNIDKPLSGEQIAEVVQAEGLANYFEAFHAIEDLFRSNHLKISLRDNDVDLYSVSDLGRETSQSLTKTVPHAVREKALLSANKMLLNLKKLSENKVCITKASDGYMVECRILDIGSDLLNIQLFAGTMEQAQSVKKNFLDNPASVYKAVLEILT